MTFTAKWLEKGEVAYQRHAAVLTKPLWLIATILVEKLAYNAPTSLLRPAIDGHGSNAEGAPSPSGSISFLQDAISIEYVVMLPNFTEFGVWPREANTVCRAREYRTGNSSNLLVRLLNSPL